MTTVKGNSIEHNNQSQGAYSVELSVIQTEKNKVQEALYSLKETAEALVLKIDPVLTPYFSGGMVESGSATGTVPVSKSDEANQFTFIANEISQVSEKLRAAHNRVEL